MELKVKRLTDTARIPEKAHQGDLGYDVFADEDKWIAPGDFKLVSTGISVYNATYKYGFIIKDRSSIAMKGLFTHAGVIDAGYTGEIKILFHNNSSTAIKIINQKVEKNNLSNFVSTWLLDIRKKLPFNDNSIEGCFSHMLYCMALSNLDLENLNKEIYRILKPGGINIYTVRHTNDGDYKNGIHIGENLYENDGFIVHFFSKEKIKQLSKGFKIINIENFEEGSFPRKLFRVTLMKQRQPQ